MLIHQTVVSSLGSWLENVFVVVYCFYTSSFQIDCMPLSSFKSINNNFNSGPPTQIPRDGSSCAYTYKILHWGVWGHPPGTVNRGLTLRSLLYPVSLTKSSIFLSSPTSSCFRGFYLKRWWCQPKGNFETCRERDIFFPLSRLKQTQSLAFSKTH